MIMWTDPMDTILREARRDGVSFSVIPRLLSGLCDASRSACIGRAKRLGLTLPASRRAQALGTGSVLKRMKARTKPPAMPCDLPMLETTQYARPWIERKAGQCAWPFDWPDGVWSCCAPVSRRGYCEAHALRMWTTQAEADRENARAANRQEFLVSQSLNIHRKAG